ncbi:hypothetical protein EGR_02812 [Echinococcus granulosus]|uniref:FAR1 domain-containing protein n=1 Tax=Echinococcus granulosus TaxID=6210 RepID=W6V7C1_ECHGR|nr:hypothetical protein EGR_02812 [Echinococcus granulosus]EUB62359.1 hypothetical protein EGR_02812 [Echinococcus granulosus]
MDFNEEFQETVANSVFPTFDLLEDAIKRFTKITGNQFALKKKVRHRTGAPMREAHKFRYAFFKCICSFSTECEAFFNVASKGQTLRITQFYMVHNHAVVYNPAFKQHGVDDDDGYDVRCDLTGQFEELFPVKSFNTFDEFLGKLHEFQDATGCIFVKRNADRYPPEAIDKQHLVYKAVKMECVHYGHRQDSKKQTHTNLRISCKIGCRCCIHVSTYKGRVTIGKYFMKHNHPVPIEEAIQYPQTTHLSANDDSHYNVVYDVTTQFVEIFSSGRFPTYQDFLVRLEEFQRVGCKSTMRISTIKGYVEIVTYEMRHNHPASQEASDEYQPQTWLLSGINVGDDDKAFKRRRRSKKQVLADAAVAQAAVATMQKTDIISDQLARLREVALAAPQDKLEVFCSQLSEFETRWRQQLMVAYQEQQQQDPSQPQPEELPDPNASPPIIPVSAGIKLETL